MISAQLAKQIREEHDALHRLIDELRAETAVIPRSALKTWLERVSERFEHLRAHLTKHMSLEERDGYLVPVVERRPTLAREVERLHHEHGELVRLMDSIHRDSIDVGPADRLLVRELCHRIEMLLQLVERHEADEDLLMLDGVVHDIGTKD